ncbi:TetR/AcrR family transcriptional regulator [Wenzhouxiangella sp. AB-CW3]|uniref:TetR/AcrR family transcriptional regulator n=1 Tax=Wenzhouxiangella sp. AB-CW3 TaxID=2771012 RepID=UPI00168A76EF|nr:TetR/AcrR family transcriptional regulator [Wenzhouxiangella sp. AB-CW3]QOC24048.1 TetR/AcrR family transcriptional regulator [Wenzhouxiangella sp. AB-CW3]
MTLSRDDWLERGLTVLARLGPEHLKVDRLCAHLKVTKGSFYHHFAHREAYVEALMDYWRQRNTRSIIEAVEAIETSHKQSFTLSQLVRSADTGPENAIRAWARYDDDVAVRLEAVDQERVDFLTRLIAAQLRDSAQAALVAKLVYAHFVGVQQLNGLVSAEEWRAMDQLLQRALTAPGELKS